jgi:hypothetical protein
LLFLLALSSVPVLPVALGLVLRHKLRGCLQGLPLFQLDSVLAVLSTSACLSVGHAEDVIGLHSAVHSAVPWNGLAQFGGLIARDLNTVEYAEGIFVALLFLLLALGISGVEFRLSALECLLLHNIIGLVEINSVELIDGVCGDGLYIDFINR